jgi:hypothetical protein
VRNNLYFYTFALNYNNPTQLRFYGLVFLMITH